MAIIMRPRKVTVLQELKQVTEEIERDIISIMQFVGEKFVKNARENSPTGGPFKQRVLTKSEKEKGKKTPGYGDYVDWTANLRSSIGYFILKNGRIIQQNVKGTNEGTAAAVSLASGVPKSGIQLIAVAGMDYASYVESKGYNVITSQADVMIVNLEELWRKNAKNKKFNI